MLNLRKWLLWRCLFQFNKALSRRQHIIVYNIDMCGWSIVSTKNGQTQSKQTPTSNGTPNQKQDSKYHTKCNSNNDAYISIVWWSRLLRITATRQCRFHISLISYRRSISNCCHRTRHWCCCSGRTKNVNLNSSTISIGRNGILWIHRKSRSFLSNGGPSA